MIPERNAQLKAGLDDLCKYAKERLHGKVTMAEIGVWTGAGTLIFSKYFDTIYAVDPWFGKHEVEEIFDARFEKSDKVIKTKSFSYDIVKEFDNGSLDMVYIDALHDYENAKHDIADWLPKVKKGGFLCGHDYWKKFPGVIRAVNELHKPIKMFKDSSWLIGV
jgi:predicted O-methyltransferase YrrM